MNDIIFETKVENINALHTHNHTHTHSTHSTYITAHIHTPHTHTQPHTYTQTHQTIYKMQEEWSAIPQNIYLTKILIMESRICASFCGKMECIQNKIQLVKERNA